MATLIVIAGPTASGKTALSIALAQALDAAIIGADSRQFYKGMDIGTAKPTPEERAAVPHHFVDFLSPSEHYAAGRYEKEVLAFLESYFQTRETALLVGGSGLFIKAVMEGLDELPSAPPAIRERWRKAYEAQGLGFLQEQLQKADPAYAREVDLRNPQRILRALEAIEASGQPFSTLRKGRKKPRPFGIAPILLFPPRSQLYERIDQRTDRMMEQGLLGEVKRLSPYRHENALNTVGYKELFAYLDGSLSLEEAVNKIKQHTRNFAKRQYTWFRKQEGFKAFEEVKTEEIAKHLPELLRVS